MIIRGAGGNAGHVVRGVECVADQHGIAARRVEGAVGFVDQLVGTETPTAGERQGIVEAMSDGVGLQTHA